MAQLEAQSPQSSDASIIDPPPVDAANLLSFRTVCTRLDDTVAYIQSEKDLEWTVSTRPYRHPAYIQSGNRCRDGYYGLVSNDERTISDGQTRDQPNAAASNSQSTHEPRELAEPGEFASLPKAEFMMPGPDRNRLVGLILDGTKTATAALLLDYTECGDPLPKVGDQSVLVDSDDRGVALLVTTAVDMVRLGDVTDQQAIDEGEGDVTVAEWRRTHESFWNSPDYRAEFADPDFPLDDDTLVVLEHFAIAERL